MELDRVGPSPSDETGSDLRLMIDDGIFVTSSPCECLAAAASLPDVRAAEAGRPTPGDASRGHAPHRGPHGAQHLVVPRSPTPGVGPTHLPDVPSGAGGLRILCLDGSHPHLSPGNAELPGWKF